MYVSDDADRGGNVRLAMNRRRLVQSAILLAGLAGIAVVVARTFDAADEQVLPSVPALVVGAVLSMLVIYAAARAWASLFMDVIRTRGWASHPAWDLLPRAAHEVPARRQHPSDREPGRAGPERRGLDS